MLFATGEHNRQERFEMNTADLINQVVWLLERMSRGQILRELQQPSPGPAGAGRENPCQQIERPENG